MNSIVTKERVTVEELAPRYGPLDFESVANFGKELIGRIERMDPPWLVLDFRQTTFVGSNFLEVLIRAWKRLRSKDGRLALCGLSGPVADVMRAARLDSLWHAFPTRDEAIQSVAREEADAK